MRKNMKNATVGNVAVVVDNTRRAESIAAQAVIDNAVVMDGVKIGIVPLDLIDIDKDNEETGEEGYQRNIDVKEVNILIRDWDSHKYGFILVSHRNGKFYCVDGQHRVTAAKYKGIKSLRCIIIENLEKKDEALLFANQDENVKKISIYEKFHANIINGDTSILRVKIDKEIYDICKKYGFKVVHACNKTKNEKILRSLYMAQRIVKAHGIDCFKWIMDTIHSTSWDTCPTSTTKDILIMLKTFYVENKDNLSYWQKAVEKVMNTYTPNQIIGCARSDYANYTMGVAMNICFKELVNGKKIIKVGVEE